MELIKSAAIAFALIFINAEYSIADQQTKIPVITNLKYNKARELLLSEGWQPAATVGPNTELFGQSDLFRKAGFPEINNCASTGASQCILYFRDVYGKNLKVVTIGESNISGDDFPSVDNYVLVDSLPTDDGQSVQAKAETPKSEFNSEVDDKTARLGGRLLVCSAIFSAFHDHSGDDKQAAELTGNASDMFREAATRLAGPRYVALTFKTAYQNAITRMKDERALGDTDLSKFSSTVNSECMSLWSKNKGKIDSVKLLSEDSYPVLMPIEPAQSEFKSGTKYTAQITCSLGARDLNVIGCFKDTELKIRTPEGTELYNAYSLSSAGLFQGNSLIVSLPEHFELSAQNSQKNLVLGIKIRNMDGKIVYSDKASQYGYIAVQN